MKSQVMDIALEKKQKRKASQLSVGGIFDAFVSEKSNLKKEADELISDLREDDEISPLSFVNTLSDVYRTQNMKSLIDFEVKVDSILPNLTEINRDRETNTGGFVKAQKSELDEQDTRTDESPAHLHRRSVRHLPGKDGLIALLLEKGYQVEPIGL